MITHSPFCSYHDTAQRHDRQKYKNKDTYFVADDFGFPPLRTEMRWLLKFPVISFLKEILRRKLPAEQIVANIIPVVILFSSCWSRKLKQSCNRSSTQELLICFLSMK